MHANSLMIGPLRLSLEITIQEQDDKSIALVKDNLTGKIFSFPMKAYEVLTTITGQMSADNFIDTFPVEQQKAILSLLEKAVQKGLLNTGVEKSAPAPSWWANFNILFIKLFRFNPRIILGPISILYAPLFTLIGVIIHGLLWVFVLYQLYEQGSFIFQQFEIFTYFESWLGVYGLLAISTLFHELGHAYCCVKYKQPVNEVGLALYMGQIAAYANVSNAWLLPNKWQRINIALAGIYVKATLPSAQYLYGYMQPPIQYQVR